MKSLTEREQRILHLRYGMAGNRKCTLKDIGTELGISGERVRQIECRALRKLAQRRKEKAMITETHTPHWETITNPEAAKQTPPIERELFCPLFSIMAQRKIHCDKQTCGMVRLCRG